MSRELNPNEDNVFLELGRLISEESYSREKKEIEVGNMKIDLLKREDGKVVVGEVKKSSKFLKAARMQLVFYLSKLKQAGVDARGELLIPKEKKIIPVVLDKKAKEELKKAETEILKIISSDNPPKPEKIRFCTKCAYREFCWA